MKWCSVVFRVENCVHQFLHLVLRSFLNYQTFLCITYHVSSDLFTLWNAYTSYELSRFLSRTQICEHFKDPTINTLKSKAKFICQTVGVRNLWEQVLGKETFEVKQCLPHQQCNHCEVPIKKTLAGRGPLLPPLLQLHHLQDQGLWQVELCLSLELPPPGWEHFGATTATTLLGTLGH